MAELNAASNFIQCQTELFLETVQNCEVKCDTELHEIKSIHLKTKDQDEIILQKLEENETRLNEINTEIQGVTRIYEDLINQNNILSSNFNEMEKKVDNIPMKIKTLEKSMNDFQLFVNKKIPLLQENSEMNATHICSENHDIQESEGGEADLQRYLIKCTKYPSHEHFIPMNRFTFYHLPESHREHNLYELIKVTAALTVRVDVRMTSSHRPKVWPNTNIPYPFNTRKTNTNLRVGSGKVSGGLIRYDEGYDTNKSQQKERYTKCWCKKCQHSTTASTVWWEFTVVTATQLVFDEAEASHTSIRLFYDNENSPVVSVDKVSVCDINIESDICKLRCVTCDKNLGEMLHTLYERFVDIWWKINGRYLESQDKFCFIVSHPNGCVKQVSIGQWVDKFKEGVYNKFTYTTVTCTGSCGASVYCLGYSGNHLVHCGSIHFKLNHSGAKWADLKTNK